MMDHDVEHNELCPKRSATMEDSDASLKVTQIIFRWDYPAKNYVAITQDSYIFRENNPEQNIYPVLLERKHQIFVFANQLENIRLRSHFQTSLLLDSNT